MKKLLLYYNFILICIITVIGFLQAESVAQIVSAILFFPLLVYFGQFILPQKHKALPMLLPEPLLTKDPLKKTAANKKNSASEQNANTNTEKATEGKVLEGFDIDRRMFLKLIGSAGLTMFFFSIFTKKAEGAFFGSVPGPGTISIKDTTGVKIDPAIKQPTDGYTIAQLDDSTSTTYYGYLNKDSAWYILKEDSSGNYRYCKGSSSFSTNWTGRAALTYDYFDAIF